MRGGAVMSLGEELKTIRRKGLLSQTEFAEKIDVSFSTVNRWENNRAVPNYQALKKIKQFCEQNGIAFDIDNKIWEEQK